MTAAIISAEQTHHLRHKVLWPHIATEEECVIDIDHSDGAIHLATMDQDRIVSIGSLFKTNSSKVDFKKQYRLRAMATDPDYRKHGCGKILLTKALDILSSQDIEVLWCDARIAAVGFYTKLGFEVIDEVYDVPRIGPHKFMYYVFGKDHRLEQ